MSIKDYILQHFSSIEEYSNTLQRASIKAREALFYDPIVGFDYSAAGVRTNASVKEIEQHLYDLSLGIVKFTLCSHRHLLMYIEGLTTPIILRCPKEYSPYNNKDNKYNNPYLKISKEIIKSMYIVMSKNISPKKSNIKDVSTSTISQNVVPKSSNMKMCADEAINLMTASVMSTIGDGNPILKLLTLYGHNIENILSDLTDEVITCKTSNDSITICNSLGLSLYLAITGKNVEDLSAQVSKALSALLIASLVDAESSNKLSKMIDIDSIKVLMSASTDHNATVTSTESTEKSTISTSKGVKPKTSNHKQAKAGETSTTIVAKFNDEVYKYQKLIKDAVMVDNISSCSFNKKVGGKLQTCAHKAGIQGKAGFGIVYPLLDEHNKKFIAELYTTCGMTLPFVA